MNSAPYPIIFALDALTGALFLLTAIGVVGTRQVLASLQLFIVQIAAAGSLCGSARDSTRLGPPLGGRGDHDRHQDPADSLAAASDRKQRGLPHPRGRAGPQHP